ncbi:MAG: lysozyme inhibitor LprI family protein [Methylocella sp.]
MLKRCKAANPGNVPERFCTDEARRSVDVVLNKLYGQITAGLKKPTGSPDDDSRNKELLKRLVASERAWIAYRDSECLHESGTMLGGSGEPTIRVECEYSFERDRVNNLFDLYKDQLPEIAK